MNAELQRKLDHRRRWEDGEDKDTAAATPKTNARLSSASAAAARGAGGRDHGQGPAPAAPSRPQPNPRPRTAPHHMPPPLPHRAGQRSPSSSSTRSLASDVSRSSSGSRPAPPARRPPKSASTKRLSAERSHPPVPVRNPPSPSSSLTGRRAPAPEPLGSQRNLSGARVLPPPGRKSSTASKLHAGQRPSFKRPERPPPPRRTYKDPDFRAGAVDRDDSSGKFTPIQTADASGQDSTPAPSASEGRKPPPLPKRDDGNGAQGPSAALQKLSSHTPDAKAREAPPTPNAQTHHRGPKDFRKPRPNSAQFQQSPVARAPPPVPHRDSSSESGAGNPIERSTSSRSTSSTSSHRPPAPMRGSSTIRRARSRSRSRSPSPERQPSPERTRSAAEAARASRRSSTHDASSSQISEEERHLLAEQGKSIFQRTMSAEKSAERSLGDPMESQDYKDNRDDDERTAGSEDSAEDDPRTRELRELRKLYEYARVLEAFDPVELGYADDYDDGEFLDVAFDDVIEIAERHDNGWWEGSLFDQSRGRAVGGVGKFPADYVRPVPDPYWMEGDDELEAAQSSGIGAATSEQGDQSDAEAEAAKVMHKRWRNANRLFLALLELVTNEFKYVLSLQICFEVYMDGILSKFGEDFVGVLFPSWQRIWQCHEGILHGLADASKASWKKLLRFPEKISPRISTRADKSRRQSVGAPMSGLRSNKVEMRALAEELDAIQLWHDNNIIEEESSLAEEDLTHFLKLLGEWSMDLCSALETMAGKLKVSSVYIRNYNNALHRYDEWTKRVPDFANTINQLEQNPMANKLNLSSFLIKPVQHVCRYPLLVREVHKYAADDASKEVVLRCQERLIEVTSEVNSLADDTDASAEGSLTLQDLRSGLRYPTEEDRVEVDGVLRRHTTQLMTYGSMGILQAGSGKELKALKTGPNGPPYECFLTNSMLLIAERYQNLLSKHRFKLRYCVDIKAVGLAGVIESGNRISFGISIRSPNDDKPFSGDLAAKPDKWIFVVDNLAARDAWLRNMEQAIYISRGVSKSGATASANGYGTLGSTATAALNAAQGRRPPSLRPLAAPASMVAGLFGQRSQSQQPASPSSGSSSNDALDDPKYNSMKDRQARLQNADPRYLLQMQKEDPLINELTNKLKQKKSMQSMQSMQSMVNTMM